MANLAENVARSLSVLDRMVANIETKGVLVPSDITAEEQADKILEIYGGGGGNGEIRVRFILPMADANGDAIIATQYVKKGDSITSYPIPPDLDDVLEFDKWTHTLAQLSNIQHDIDVGTMYKTIDGRTYFDYTLTPVSGYNPPINLTIIGTLTLRVHWGDGFEQTITSTGEISHAHPSQTKDYQGWLEIVSGTGSYSLGRGGAGTAFFGSSIDTYKQAIRKCYMGERAGVSIYAFHGCSSITSVVLPDGLTSLNVAAFYQCRSLTSVVLPDSVTIVNDSVFNGCRALHSAVLPDGVASVGAYAFYQCFSLTSIVLPDGVASVGAYAFYQCFSFTSVVLPGGIKSVGDSAFYECFSLEHYVFLSVVPPTLGSSVFLGMVSIRKIFAPDGSVGAYKTGTNWVAYADYIYPISERP